jgi:serine protease
MKLSTIGLAAALFAIGLAGAGASPINYTSSIPVQISDLSTASSTINIGTYGRVRDINVALNITHSFDADLILSLTHAGVTVLLSNRNGGSGGADYLDTRFDDSAAVAINAGFAYAPYIGTFRPEEALAAFIDHDISGDWTLTAIDMEEGDSGVLNGWRLVAEVPEPGSLAMFGIGMVALGAMRKRRQG